jgi:hypothetical protein
MWEAERQNALSKTSLSGSRAENPPGSRRLSISPVGSVNKAPEFLACSRPHSMRESGPCSYSLLARAFSKKVKIVAASTGSRNL